MKAEQANFDSFDPCNVETFLEPFDLVAPPNAAYASTNTGHPLQDCQMGRLAKAFKARAGRM